VIITRVFDSLNKWTFQIKAIDSLLKKYEVGTNWIDPFAGETIPAEFTNDLNKNRNAKYHYFADEFCHMMAGPFNGILFDPPYSYRQVKECYEDNGFKATQLDTSANFYTKVQDEIFKKIKKNGIAISFGWNSNGFGKCRGFEIIEILLIAHGLHHNDTICTVERKIQSELF
jgi:hypothetical protein